MKTNLLNTARYLATALLVAAAMLMPQMANADGTPPSGSGTASSPYQLGNADDLYWFADQVNSGNYTACALLTDDIVVNVNVLETDGNLNVDSSDFRIWEPIGFDTDGQRYEGVFDGGGHTISGLYFNDDTKSVVGLFCSTASNAVIKNVGVVDSYFHALQHVSGICGSNRGTVANCFNAATCWSPNNLEGGIVSWNEGSVSNCYNRGVSQSLCYYNNGSVANCFFLMDKCSCGVVQGDDGTSGMSAKDFAGGEVAWLLNGSEAGENPTWRQTIGDDDFPVLDPAKGIVIKAPHITLNALVRPTAGTLVGGDVYNFGGLEGKKIYGIPYYGKLAANHPYVFQTNDDYVSFVPSDEVVTDDTDTCGLTGVLDYKGKTVYGPYNIVDEPACILFSTSQPIYAAPNGTNVGYGKCYINTEEGTLDGEPVAMAKSIANFSGEIANTQKIANTSDLYSFATRVNNGSTKFNAILKADIVVNENVLNDMGLLNNDGEGFKSWTPIGFDTDGQRFEGIFDGQGHTISGLYVNDDTKSCVGLFGSTASTAAIKNVGVVDSYFHANENVAGICGSNLGIIENCFNAATCTASNDNIAAGIASYNDGSITYCYNVGLLNENSGGICYRNYSGSIADCYFISGPANGIYVENYDEKRTAEKSAAQFASGEVAFMLNKDGSREAPCWRQTIGEDAYPVLNNTRGIVLKPSNVIANTIVQPTAGSLEGATNVYNFCGIYGTDIFGIEYTGKLAANHPYIFFTDNEYVSFTPTNDAVTDDTDTFGLIGVLDSGGKTVYGYKNTLGEPASIVITDPIPRYANDFGETVKYGYCYIDAEEGILPSSPDMADAQPISKFLVDGLTVSISNETELYWFAEIVNSGYTKINAKLTADIVVNENVLNDNHDYFNGDGSAFRVWTPIGIDAEGQKYDGRFDGQGHTISGLYINSEQTSICGLFSSTASNAVIINVGILDSYFYAVEHVAGLCGSNSGTIANCFSDATCNSLHPCVEGGIVSWNGGSIIDCYYTGKSVYFCHDNSGTITNCYCYDIYCLDGIKTGTGDLTPMAGSQFASGEVAWRLNREQASENPAWRQTIGKDDRPVTDKTHGIVIAAPNNLNAFVRPEDGTLENADRVFEFVGIYYTYVYGEEYTDILKAGHPYVFTALSDYVSFSPCIDNPDEPCSTPDPSETHGLVGVLNNDGVYVEGEDSIVFCEDYLYYASWPGRTIKYGECYVDSKYGVLPNQLDDTEVIGYFLGGAGSALDQIDAGDDSDSQKYNILGIPVGDNYRGFVISRGSKTLRK